MLESASVRRKVSMRTELMHSEESMYCNRLTLTFRVRVLEQEFQDRAIACKIRFDSIAHVLGILGGTANLLQIWGQVPTPVTVLQCFAAFVFAPTNAYMRFFNRVGYTKWRTPSVICLWLISLVLVYYNERYDCASLMLGTQPDGVTTWGLIRTSPVAFMNAMALNLPLPFHLHVYVNLVAMVVLGMWMVAYCSDPGKASGIGNVNPGLVSEDLYNGVSSGNPMVGAGGCGVRVLFGLLVLGFVVPSTILYCLELTARGKFLEKRLQRDERNLVSWLTWELRMSAIATALAMLLKAWLWSVGEG